MNKKAIVLGVLAVIVLSLSSCRSKKNSCSKANIQIEQTQPEITVACVE